MPRLFCVCLLLISATAVWSQVEPAATGGGFDLDDLHMMTPPPVSGDAYPVMVGSEIRSNYLGGGLVFTGAYMDNLLATNAAGGAVADETYAIQPTFDFDRRTPRQGESLTYTTGATLYQHTSALNGITQNSTAGYRFHISPYAVIEFHDAFAQNYNLYNQGNPFTGSGVSGAPGSTGTVLVAPFANQLSNSTSADIDYQYGRNAMIGGSATYSFLHYLGNSNTAGLSDGDSTGATAFYSRRLARAEYVGVVYQFSKFTTHPIETYTVTHTIFGFYTHYFTRSISVSVLAGPEQYTPWSRIVPKQAHWTPAVQGSIGWESPRLSASVSYSRIVAGAGGLVGTYKANLVGLSVQMALSRKWSIGGMGNYSLLDAVNSSAAVNGPGGHTLVGTGFLRRRIAERLSVEAGYGHFHETYNGLSALSGSPDSNRAYGSINYSFLRPLGR